MMETVTITIKVIIDSSVTLVPERVNSVSVKDFGISICAVLNQMNVKHKTDLLNLSLP